MKTPAFFLTTLLLLTAAAPLVAQDTGKVTTQQLIEQLGDSDYEVRKAAETQLLERGSKALDALQKSAKSHEDPEVKWRAGRLVRRLEDRSAGETPRKLGKREASRDEKIERGDEQDKKSGGETADPRRVVERVMRDLDKAFEGRELGGDVHREIERAMEQVRKNLRMTLPDLDIDNAPPGSKIQRSSSRSMKMSQNQDGVRVEITEPGKDGKPETKVYEAEDMESFRKKHPGVLKDHGVHVDMGKMFGGDFPLEFRGRMLKPRIHRDGGGFRVELESDGDTKRDTKLDTKREEKVLRKKDGGRQADVVERRRLGFYVGEISPAVRDYLNLKGGLMVNEVAEGSIAAKIGLRKGDIVTKVGDKTIRAIEDVADALDAIGDGKVVVTIIRRGREMKLD